MKFASDFITSKVTLTCLGAIATAVGEYLSGNITQPQMLGAIFLALVAMWKRDADAKGREKVVEAQEKVATEVQTLRQSVAGVPPSERVVTGDS